ncbi:hypothetical protein ACMX2M_16760 [Paenibacillus polymyxa]
MNKNSPSTKAKELSIGMSRRIMELYLWLAIALIISAPQIYFWLRFRDPSYFFENYTNFLFSTFTFIFPILYQLIFGQLPLESIRNQRKKTLLKHSNRQVSKSESVQEDKVIESSNESRSSNSLEETELEIFLIDQIKQSSEIANKIFSRSGAYLLIGCLIAFGGVMIFLYYGSIGEQNSYDLQSLMIQFLPKLGSLFFVEFVAIFFLKQSKLMMEEYRYYDKLKRIRQDNLSIIKIVKENEGKNNVETILEHCNFERNPRFLAKDETTEILEAQRLLNEERDPLEKIIELIKLAKIK